MTYNIITVEDIEDLIRECLQEMNLSFLRLNVKRYPTEDATGVYLYFNGLPIILQIADEAVINLNKKTLKRVLKSQMSKVKGKLIGELFKDDKLIANKDINSWVFIYNPNKWNKNELSKILSILAVKEL